MTVPASQVSVPSNSTPLPCPSPLVIPSPTPSPSTPSLLSPSLLITSPDRHIQRRAQKKENKKRRRFVSISSQPRPMDECDFYCSSLSARLRRMPRLELRVKIEELFLNYEKKFQINIFELKFFILNIPLPRNLAGLHKIVR